jgi:PTH1 family peptidyl-tRNA hydrolase
VIRLVLGLGNPGEEYAATRHNAGFRVIDELARRFGVRLDRIDCNALTALVHGDPPPPAVGDPPRPALSERDAPALGDRPKPALGNSLEAAALGEAPEPTLGDSLEPAVSAGWWVLLAKPETYMNRSGYAARCLVERHGIAPAAVLVVYDEVNLPLGRLRLRRSGSPAGHRGIESIIENLRSDQVARLRIGVAPAPVPSTAGAAPASASAGAMGEVGGEHLADFVLAPFTAAEELALAPVIQSAADACEVWLREGIDAAMNRFNGV